ncbi:NfeD family protein [Aerococcus sanguinicola]|uniref:NfeD family protein n=1 Tax=Aerococcus sanguinicola TaxID=119206 RepID=UPI0018A78537|nr:NfeD family protein [Aerococcus sanguinicola]
MALIIFIISILCLVYGFQGKYRLGASALSLGLALVALYLWDPGHYAFIGVLALGLALVIFEAFLPSLGILGLIGLGMLAFEIFQQRLSLGALGFEVLAALYLGLVTAVLMIRLVLASPQAQTLVLKDQPGSQGKRGDQELLLGQQAKVVAPLRPVGKVRVSDGRAVEAINEQDFVDRGQAVEIIAVRTKDVKVRRIDHD